MAGDAATGGAPLLLHQGLVLRLPAHVYCGSYSSYIILRVYNYWEVSKVISLFGISRSPVNAKACKLNRCYLLAYLTQACTPQFSLFLSKLSNKAQQIRKFIVVYLLPIRGHPGRY